MSKSNNQSKLSYMLVLFNVNINNIIKIKDAFLMISLNKILETYKVILESERKR